MLAAISWWPSILGVDAIDTEDRRPTRSGVPPGLVQHRTVTVSGSTSDVVGALDAVAERAPQRWRQRDVRCEIGHGRKDDGDVVTSERGNQPVELVGKSPTVEPRPEHDVVGSDDDADEIGLERDGGRELAPECVVSAVPADCEIDELELGLVPADVLAEQRRPPAKSTARQWIA